MTKKNEETGENYFRKSPSGPNQVRYQHLALLLNKQDEVPVNEKTVRQCAINKVNSILNRFPGQRQELDIRKQVLLNTHIRAVNKVKCTEEVGNNLFDARQGVKAKSDWPDPQSDSDSNLSDSESSDSDLSDSESESESEEIESEARGCFKDLGLDNNAKANKSDFEAEIEAAFKKCSINSKVVSSGKKALLTKKTVSVGLKRKQILEQSSTENEVELPRKRSRSHA